MIYIGNSVVFFTLRVFLALGQFQFICVKLFLGAFQKLNFSCAEPNGNEENLWPLLL